MFLPVLLVRDFGPAGWFVFAIPNVVGAAAMGWVIRSRAQSEAFVENHATAARLFSLTTIAFHVYVVLWILPTLIGPAATAIAFGLMLLVAFPLLTTTLAATTLAVAALAASVLLAIVLLGLGALAWPPAPIAWSTVDLISLGIVCVLGFLTCPYLDLTFHRASQASRTPGESRVAFGVGFGLCFAAMILLTLFYAHLFYLGARVALAIVGVHVCVQAIFTVGVHAAALRRSLPRAGASLAIAIAVAAAFGMTARLLDAHGLGVGTFYAGEVGYRTFMAFYGLLAPAYVWICVRRADEPPQAIALRNAAIATLVAVPFFWIGFMHATMRWALPGVIALSIGWLATVFARRNAAARERAFRALGGQFP